MPDDPGESFIIHTLLNGRPTEGVLTPVVDAGDDVAVLDAGLAVGTDMMVEGVHWDHRLSPSDVGWKLVAVNASDLGATGACPRWATLTVSLPSPPDLAFLTGFSEGLHAALSHFGVALIGGDTTRSSGPCFVSMTMGGHVEHPVQRSGARAGDIVWVTGTLGDAAAGFHHGAEGLSALRRPQPPIGFGVALGRSGIAGAMMDLSDGLARDVSRMAAASQCAIRIDASALPASPQVQRAPDRLALQTAFGEDYEFLFTAQPDASADVVHIAERYGVAVTQVGQCEPGQGASLRDGGWPPLRFSHFGGEA